MVDGIKKNNASDDEHKETNEEFAFWPFIVALSILVGFIIVVVILERRTNRE